MNSIEKPTIEETPEEKEDFTSIRRVIGRKYEDISDDEKKKVFEHMEEIFKDQSKVQDVLLGEFGNRENVPDEFVKVIFYEREKSSQEKAIIELANEKTNELRKKYKLPDLNIPLQNIYVLPQDVPWPKNFTGNSFFYPMLQFITIRDQCKADALPSGYPRLIFLADVLHEMTHFKSYNSLKKLEGLDAYYPYRAGLEIYPRKNSEDCLFSNLNEAVVQEIAIRTMRELEKHPIFKEEVEEREQMKEKLSGEETRKAEPFISGEEYYLNSMLWRASYGKEEERKILNKLIDKIFQKEQSKNEHNRFQDREEIFELFSEALITGNIIPLGRVIDENFGKGTFRKISAADHNVNQLEKYIDSL